MNRKILLICISLLPLILTAQIPTNWNTTGIGGGAAFYAPSINPADSSEYYISSEMSQVFRTTNFGASYSLIYYKQLQGGPHSKVCFTNNSSIRYCISYVNDLALPAKTTNGGTTWNTFVIMVNGQPDSSEAVGIWADYKNPNRVVVATPNIIYFSNDGGATFAFEHYNLNNNIGLVVGGVFFDGNNIYIGTNDGLIESSDGGGTFNPLTATGIATGEAIYSFAAAKQGSALRFFCLTGNETSLRPGMLGSDFNGIFRNAYRMDNNNGTWAPCMDGISYFSDVMMFVAMAENDTATAYVGGTDVTNDPLGEPNVLKTADGGATWTHVFQTQNNANINTAWAGDSGDYNWGFSKCIMGLTVDPQNKNIVVVTDLRGVMKSNDAGASWNQGYVNPADQHTSSAVTPVRQYYRSVGLENTSSWYLHWSDSANVIAGCSDVFAMRSKDGGSSWSYDYTSAAVSKNTVYCVAKNIADGTLYAATSSVAGLYKIDGIQDANIDAETGEIIFSNDSGASWSVLHNFGDPVYWVATDPNKSDRLYASVVNSNTLKGGIWYTDSVSKGAASVWTKLATPVRTQGHPAVIKVLKNGYVLCTFSARTLSNGVLQQSAGVFIYNTDSAKWYDKSAASQKYWCQDIVVDVNDSSQNTWYCAVYEGFGGKGINSGGLYRTTNGGTSWARIFSGGDVNSCAVNPKNKNEMFVATNGNGLWYTFTMNGPTPNFTQVTSYKFSAPQRIFFNPFDETKVWITTNGNGLQWADKVTTGFAEFVNDKDQLIFYPNPASNNVVFNMGDNITHGETFSGVIRVFDLAGREEKVSGEFDGNNIRIDVSDLKAGIYIVQLKLNDYFYTGKLIKQ